MARSYLSQAEIRIRMAEIAFERQNYPYVVRQSQEAVELSLKAALRLIGIEPPRWHDVGPILRRFRERFPEWFRNHIEELAFISRQLRREREPSMYGDEELGIPPNELYTRYDAQIALNWARRVYELCRRLYNELL